MITGRRAAEIFSEHARELVLACRKAPRGFRVLAEVSGDGQWRGAGVVTAATGSLLAHEGRGYALYLEANRFTAYSDVEQAIAEWLLARGRPLLIEE